MGICGASADSTGAGCVAGEVATVGVDNDGGVVKIGGMAYCQERRDPRRGFLLHSHKRREWDVGVMLQAGRKVV